MTRDAGSPQGGMRSEAGKAAYWRMQYESAIGALADLIAENTENVEFARDFYSHNADRLSDYWRAEFTRILPPASTNEHRSPAPEIGTERSGKI